MSHFRKMIIIQNIDEFFTIYIFYWFSKILYNVFVGREECSIFCNSFYYLKYQLYPFCLQKISPNLSKLVNYIEAVHFPGFDVEGKFYQMSSFGESKAFKYFEDPEKAKDFVRYNSRQISRIYPGATRQDSSNLKPMAAWNTGCQIGKFHQFELY